jgi:hypothetical protein
MSESEKTWAWYDNRDMLQGFVNLTDKGLGFNVEDDYYNGEMSREQAISLAHAILEKFLVP